MYPNVRHRRTEAIRNMRRKFRNFRTSDSGICSRTDRQTDTLITVLCSRSNSARCGATVVTKRWFYDSTSGSTNFRYHDRQKVLFAAGIKRNLLICYQTGSTDAEPAFCYYCRRTRERLLATIMAMMNVSK